MKQSTLRFLAFSILIAFCCLLCSCIITRSKLQEHTNPDGSFSVGSEVISLRNSSTISKIVRNKEFTNLRDLCHYMGSGSHGRARQRATDIRYDIWYHASCSRSLRRQTFCMLAVESDNQIITRMVYMTSTGRQRPRFIGNHLLAHALKDAMKRNSFIEPLNKAYAGVEERKDRMMKAFFELDSATRRELAANAAKSGKPRLDTLPRPRHLIRTNAQEAKKAKDALSAKRKAPQENSEQGLFSKIATYAALGALDVATAKYSNSGNNTSFLSTYMQHEREKEEANNICRRCRGGGISYHEKTGAPRLCPDCHGYGTYR